MANIECWIPLQNLARDVAPNTLDCVTAKN